MLLFNKQNKPHTASAWGPVCRLPILTLKSLGNGTGTDATGADFDGPDGAVVDSLHLLQVGVPGGTGLVVGVAHIVACAGAFTTNFTFS